MATATNPKVTRVVPDDGPGFIIGMVLFTLLIPALFFLSWWLSPLADEGRPVVHGPTAPAAEAPAEAAPAP
jgi:hypothetical protein